MLSTDAILEKLKKVLDETLGQEKNSLVQKVIDKELKDLGTDCLELEIFCRKIKNVVALFIDKNKAETIHERFSEILKECQD